MAEKWYIKIVATPFVYYVTLILHWTPQVITVHHWGETPLIKKLLRRRLRKRRRGWAQHVPHFVHSIDGGLNTCVVRYNPMRRYILEYIYISVDTFQKWLFFTHIYACMELMCMIYAVRNFSLGYRLLQLSPACYMIILSHTCTFVSMNFCTVSNKKWILGYAIQPAWHQNEYQV